MKRIDTFLSFLLSFYACICSAQTHSQSIQDNKVLEKKKNIIILLATEQIALKRQKTLLEQIKIEEDKYQDKIGPLSNISNSVVYLVLVATMTDLEDKIAKIEYNITVRKFATFGIRHGLSGFESELQRQKKYFLKLKEEYQIVLTYSVISGGAGYNYTAFLKLLQRIIKVRSKIFQIDKEVKNIMGISQLLSK